MVLPTGRRVSQTAKQSVRWPACGLAGLPTGRYLVFQIFFTNLFTNKQGLICNSGRWWNATADFSQTKFPPDVVELSGTGVPPGWLDEVQERRFGAYTGGGTAFRLVPAEIKHCQ